MIVNDKTESMYSEAVAA